MTPKSFDHATSRYMVGDDRARVIESKARADADLDKHDPPQSEAVSYWARTQESFATVVYLDQFRRRRDRIERKQEVA